MRRRVKQPFRYGRFVVSYRENKPKTLMTQLKREINTNEEAQAAANELKESGYVDVTIHQIR